MTADDGNMIRAPAERLGRFCTEILLNIGADAPSAEASSRAMMHGSIHGIDSHGVRLLSHYVTAFRGGRLNKTPDMKLDHIRSGTALLDADHAHGALATFTAMNQACDMAKEGGIAAVGIRNSSHFGPAGAYTMAGAGRGMIALAFCNSDSFVRLHDGASRFHGTNPISMAVPTAAANPWLLDMATSAVPYNRVLLYRSLEQTLPENVASDPAGFDTSDPWAAEMLAPVGAQFGFKGAGLAGIAEIFSAVLTGMRLSPEIPPMNSEDMETPRELGAFVIALDPDGFIGAELVAAGVKRYIDLLRSSSARPGLQVLAPGDREWAEATRRREHGIPLDPDTVLSMEEMGTRCGVPLPFSD